MLKQLLISLLLLTSIISYSQVVNGKQKKLAKHASKGNWETLALRTEVLLMNQKNASDAELYLYLAISYSHISNICDTSPKLLKKYPEFRGAYKKSLAYAKKSKKFDKANRLFPANDSILYSIAYQGLAKSDAYINDGKISKAGSYYRKCSLFIEDDNFTFMNGVTAAYLNKNELAKEIINNTILALESNSHNKNNKTDYLLPIGFMLFYEYLMENEKQDSAKLIIKKAQLFFPENKRVSTRANRDIKQ